jgi:hypothetical protein
MVIAKCADGPYAGRTVMFQEGRGPVDVHGLGSATRVEWYTLERDSAGNPILRHIPDAGVDREDRGQRYDPAMD